MSRDATSFRIAGIVEEVRQEREVVLRVTQSDRGAVDVGRRVILEIAPGTEIAWTGSPEFEPGARVDAMILGAVPEATPLRLVPVEISLTNAKLDGYFGERPPTPRPTPRIE